MICTATGIAQAGHYMNCSFVTATDSEGDTVMDEDPSHYFGVEPGILIEKKTNGRIIPVAYQVQEKAFYFLVSITVTNCGQQELTGVVMVDKFSNEAVPFDPSGPGTVVITSTSNPSGFEKETLTWTVGSIPIGESRTLLVKVGTEFNPSGRLEPTSTPQTIFYNGQDQDQSSRPKATADGGLSVSVNAVALSNGPEISCVGSDGGWVNQPDKCTQMTSELPVVYTATAP